jgi:hypothetical protein
LETITVWGDFLYKTYKKGIRHEKPSRPRIISFSRGGFFPWMVEAATKNPFSVEATVLKMNFGFLHIFSCCSTGINDFKVILREKLFGIARFLDQ